MAIHEKPIPTGSQTLIPMLMVEKADRLIDFLKEAFDAKENSRMAWPDGTIMHAELKIGGSIVMINEARGDAKPTRYTLYLYVHDCDAVYKRALEAGATSQMEPQDQFWGDRQGSIKDFAGNEWWIATHIEEVSPEEMEKRAKEMIQKFQQECPSEKKDEG
jgi:PhnB protein